MYSVQNNHLLQQLTQLTCGVVATVTNSRVRSTPRKLNLTSNTNSSKNKTVTVTEALSASQTISQKTLGPLLSAQFSKLGLPGLKTDPEFNQVVSILAEKVISRGRSAEIKEPEAITKIWDDVIDTVNNTQFENEWSNKFLKMQKTNLLRHLEKTSAQEEMITSSSSDSFLAPYLRLTKFFDVSRSNIDIDKRFLRPSHGVYNAVQFRTFKTKRDIKAAEERNPSMSNRIKASFFKDKDKDGKDRKTYVDPSTTSSEKLKSMVQDLPPNEADKLKIAFAEGYMSGSGGGNGEGKGKAYRWLRTLQQVLAIAVFTAILASLMGNQSSFGGGMFRVNVGNGNEVQPEDISVTFDDVKGVDEAKQELQEIVEFLKNPSKFVALGGKLPKGVLLVGPPGTGKTLLARAVAGEAGVPFFHAAGPEFDEILVGQGARRVRDLFKAAKVKAPCVVFIDEIDSVGAKRTNSVLHPYANQTINQLLSEMDGFRQNEGVIVLGATNRREDLDKALLRPGRFDVEVPVPAPEYAGRVEILEYYLTKVKVGTDVDVPLLARGTTGFTGADLENMINQAALKAAIDGADNVGKKHLDFARDKVIMGPQRKCRIPDEETNKITAYHEAGHAIAAYYTKDSNPIHKVTIIPRGPSLGHTAYIPDKEQYHVTKSQLMALMDTMMGGRAAEELIFGNDKITSGASNDLKQATSIATHMVKEFGMSDKVGLRTIEDNSKSLVSVNDLGPQTSELIDCEIKRLLQESYERAKCIIKSHAKEHKALAEALMQYETLDSDDVKAILAGQPPQLPHLKNKPHPTASTGTSGGLHGPGSIAGGNQKRLNPC